MFSWDPKITADRDCSHEIVRGLLLGRKAMTNLLPTKVHLVKDMVFPVVMYGCESWTIKKSGAEELILLNFGVGDYSLDSLELQGDQASQS